jgi:hypothetical protein
MPFAPTGNDIGVLTRCDKNQLCTQLCHVGDSRMAFTLFTPKQDNLLKTGQEIDFTEVLFSI